MIYGRFLVRLVIYFGLWLLLLLLVIWLGLEHFRIILKSIRVQFELIFDLALFEYFLNYEFLTILVNVHRFPGQFLAYLG